MSLTVDRLFLIVDSLVNITRCKRNYIVAPDPPLSAYSDMPSLTTIQICIQLLGCMPVVVDDTHQTWICQLQSGCPVTCSRNILSNKQPRSLESNCSSLFHSPYASCVNLLCEVGFRLVRIRSAAASTGRSGKAPAAGNGNRYYHFIFR